MVIISGAATDDLEILQALASQVAVALENVRLHEENCRQYEEMLATAKRHQAEIKKIVADLHEGIGGLTTNIIGGCLRGNIKK